MHLEDALAARLYPSEIHALFIIGFIAVLAALLAGSLEFI